MIFPTVIKSRITCAEVFSVRTISKRGITWAGLSTITSQLAIEETNDSRRRCQYLQHLFQII